MRRSSSTPSDRERQRQQVVGPRLSNGGGGQTPTRPLQPPVKLVPLEHDRPDDLREGERQHREVDAGEPHREPAEQQRAERARASGAATSASSIGSREPLHQQRRAVGAEAEIGGMAERMHAARPHDEVQAGGEQHRDQHVDASTSA